MCHLFPFTVQWLLGDHGFLGFGTCEDLRSGTGCLGNCFLSVALELLASLVRLAG